MKTIIFQIKTSVLLRAVARQSWEFLHEDIKLKEVLGEGQFGEVRAGEMIINGRKTDVAIKIVIQMIIKLFGVNFFEPTNLGCNLLGLFIVQVI